MWPYLLLGLLLSHTVAPLTIVTGAAIGLLSPRWAWVVIGSAIAGIVVALIPLGGILGRSVSQVAESPDLIALGVAAGAIACLIWAAMVFWVKQTCIRAFRVVRSKS